MSAHCHGCEAGAGRRLAVGAYLGRVTRSTAAATCHLSVVAHPEARILPEHGHDWPFVSMLLSGSYVSRTRTREIEFTPSLAIYHPRAFRHRDEIGRGGGRFLCLQFDPALLRDAETRRRRPDRDLLSLRDDAAYLTLGGLYCALWAEADGLVFDGLAAELAARLFEQGRDGQGGEPAWLARVEDRLRGEEPVSLGELSHEAGVHATTLTRIFRRHKSCSVGEYRARVRARRAFGEIVGGDAPLAEVSCSAGYADQSHMTRDFKLVFGLTPGAVRSKARRG